MLSHTLEGFPPSLILPPKMANKHGTRLSRGKQQSSLHTQAIHRLCLGLTFAIPTILEFRSSQPLWEGMAWFDSVAATVHPFLRCTDFSLDHSSEKQQAPHGNSTLYIFLHLKKWPVTPWLRFDYCFLV